MKKITHALENNPDGYSVYITLAETKKGPMATQVLQFIPKMDQANIKQSRREKQNVNGGTFQKSKRQNGNDQIEVS